jgi:hypothetical protein
MEIADEFEKINMLKKNGAITEDEYQEAKKILLLKMKLDDLEHSSQKNKNFNINQYCMFIHFSQLFGYMIPILGLVVPVVLWQIKKGESELIDKNGKNVINWLLTSLIGC